MKYLAFLLVSLLLIPACNFQKEAEELYEDGKKSINNIIDEANEVANSAKNKKQEVDETVKNVKEATDKVKEAEEKISELTQ